MVRVEGGEIVRRPQSSGGQLAHLVSDLWHDRKKLEQLRNLNQRTEQSLALMVGIAQMEYEQRGEAIRQTEATNALLENIQQIKNQELQQQAVSNDLNRASLSQLQTITSTLRTMHDSENTERSNRLVLHQISMEMDRLDKLRDGFPEWALLSIEVLEDLLVQNNISISNFSSSFSDLEHAQLAFDRLNTLKDELLSANGSGV
jgi:hypothetical protein